MASAVPLIARVQSAGLVHGTFLVESEGIEPTSPALQAGACGHNSYNSKLAERRGFEPLMISRDRGVQLASMRTLQIIRADFSSSYSFSCWTR